MKGERSGIFGNEGSRGESGRIDQVFELCPIVDDPQGAKIGEAAINEVGKTFTSCLILRGTPGGGIVIAVDIAIIITAPVTVMWISRRRRNRRALLLRGAAVGGGGARQL